MLPAGLSWQPRYVRPTLWTDPSQPRSAVEPLLPDSLAGGDEEGEGQAAAAALGFREVALDMEEVRGTWPQPPYLVQASL